MAMIWSRFFDCPLKNGSAIVFAATTYKPQAATPLPFPFPRPLLSVTNAVNDAPFPVIRPATSATAETVFPRHKAPRTTGVKPLRARERTFGDIFVLGIDTLKPTPNPSAT
jgi:hypothetical protein